MIRTSDQIADLSAALAKAQGEFPTIAKNKTAKVKGVSRKTGKEFELSYSYADIADVLAAVMPILSKNGIAMLQPTVLDGNALMIVTRLMHASGQWIESDYPVCGLDGDHQKMGGAVTYARRYGLCALIGVAAEEDVDGEEAAKPVPAARQIQKQQPYRAANAEPMPFDDEPEVTASVDQKGVAEWRKEITACASVADLEALARTPEFKKEWAGWNVPTREAVTRMLSTAKATFSSRVPA